MPKLLKNGELLQDVWRCLDADYNGSPDGHILFPLAYWLEHRKALLSRPNSGLWLNSDDEPEALARVIPALPCIAVNFPTFTDGRGFSLARLLRERYNYGGELRAVGSILADQLYYLKRCGFDSYEMADHVKTETVLNCSNSFSVNYQVTGTVN